MAAGHRLSQADGVELFEYDADGVLTCERVDFGADGEIDQEIPGPLFAAVAQVLAWVFQLRAALASGRPLPEAPAAIVVPPELDPLNKIRRRPARGGDQ